VENVLDQVAYERSMVCQTAWKVQDNLQQSSSIDEYDRCYDP
jgi:hypothetical protein